MLFIRAAALRDLDALAQMARTARPVLHSLPHDRDALRARIASSDASFDASFDADVDAPGEESYLFVLEDRDTGRLLGTAGIVAAAGYPEPFYAFRNDALIHASRELQVNRKIHALTMSHELTGMSRFGGFYVDPSLRGGAAADLVSRARMMYVAMHRGRFASEVFSLLPGVTDEAGASPFWEAVGRKFFGRDFRDVEVASGGRSRTFIAEVMPAYPLYVPLLPAAAQRVLGEPDPHARLAYRIHRDEGFEVDRYVDIFDAGPVLTVPVERAASVASGETRVVCDAGEIDGAAAAASWLVASDTPHGPRNAFRCVLATLPRADARAPLDAPTQAVLGVRRGDSVYCAPLRQDRHASPSVDARPGAPQ